MNEWANWEKARARLLEDASSEVSELLMKAIADLPPRDLIILEWRAAGMSFAQIGKELDMSEPAARKAWERCKRRVKMSLMRDKLFEELFNQ